METARANSEDLNQCIAACFEALRACHACAAADIREGASAQCALINLDCAAACEAAIQVMLRNSPHHGDFCALCAHLCTVCAAACAKHASTHDHCARCQQACEACAQECRKHAPEKHD